MKTVFIRQAVFRRRLVTLLLAWVPTTSSTLPRSLMLFDLTLAAIRGTLVRGFFLTNSSPCSRQFRTRHAIVVCTVLPKSKASFQQFHMQKYLSDYQTAQTITHSSTAIRANWLLIYSECVSHWNTVSAPWPSLELGIFN